MRRDKVDDHGKVSLRFSNQMLHLGVGRAWNGTRVRLYIAGLEVRVVTEETSLQRPTHHSQTELGIDEAPECTVHHHSRT